MSIPEDESKISPHPEAVAVTKTIQELTIVDMVEIAKATGGKFIDHRRVYDFENGTVIWSLGKYDTLSFTLRQIARGRSEQVIWVKGGGIERIFSNAHTLTLGENSVTIQNPEAAEGSLPSLTLNRDGLVYNALFNQS